MLTIFTKSWHVQVVRPVGTCHMGLRELISLTKSVKLPKLHILRRWLEWVSRVYLLRMCLET